MATPDAKISYTALVLNAPFSRFKGDGEKFEDMESKGIAGGYIISANDYARLSVGCLVVLLDKERGRRVEGQLIKLEATEKAGNGQQRYDVYFQNGEEAQYKAERLNRNGVAVI